MQHSKRCATKVDTISKGAIVNIVTKETSMPKSTENTKNIDLPVGFETVAEEDGFEPLT